jgi:hypothetical protein
MLDGVTDELRASFIAHEGADPVQRFLEKPN